LFSVIENLDVLNTFLVLFYPFAPHLCEELNEILGGADTLQHASWPKHDESKTVDSKAQIVVQINGKVKDKIEMPAGSGEEDDARRQAGEGDTT
jgi:leucyl-tRNA synthetase